ncbi:hypothetical protein BGW38_004196 [Lunasporangiospora selenospora]|uniref:Uncharacterized protein n=1 Tax=Lunasporangiospora selenospora TaxID=979761 RepID=A0A9P6FQ16_9FUNG|nr:hypothetical protein BGW38_004196 [Lunasporangiospora selenospora]
MRSLLVYVLAVALPALSLASQESFCEGESSHQGLLFGRPAQSNKVQELPGYVFIDNDRIVARVHGPTFWHIKGELSKTIELDTLFDPVTFTLNHPVDFDGPFTGSISEGEIVLRWKSGATITGRSDYGNYEVSGVAKAWFTP